MADEPVLVQLKVKRGPGELTAAQVKGVLDTITEKLKNPESDESKAAATLEVEVTDLRLGPEDPAFVAEAFIIAMAIKFAGGAAAAGGALFFDKVIKPRIVAVSANGVDSATPLPEAKTDGDPPGQ